MLGPTLPSSIWRFCGLIGEWLLLLEKQTSLIMKYLIFLLHKFALSKDKLRNTSRWRKLVFQHQHHGLHHDIPNATKTFAEF